MIGWRTLAGAAGVGPALSLTYLQSATDDANLNSSYTFTGQNLGGAEAGRRIVVAAVMRGGGINDVTGGTVGGVPLTRHAVSSVAVGQWLALFSAEVPTGTMADVVVNFSGTSSRAAIALYSVTGGSSVPTDTDSRATAGALSLDVAAGGVCVAAAYGYDTLSFTWSWTGATEDDEFTTEIATLRCSVAGMESASAQTLTVTPTPTRILDDFNAAAVAYRPVNSRYLDVAALMGAVSLMDGFTDAIASVPYSAVNIGAESGVDPYGHTVLQSTAGNQYISRAEAGIVSGSYTLVGATNLEGCYTGSDFPRLATFSASGSYAFISRAAARVTASVARETFTADPGTWHWFAYTVDHSSTWEVSTLYRDGLQFTTPITHDSVPPAAYNAVTFGGLTVPNRNIGKFSACALFDSALTPEQISDLYAAYQRGL